MFKYRLHYLADSDSDNWKTYESESEVQVGDVLKLACGFYHVVVDIKAQKTGVRLDMSKSAQDPEEAELLAKQDGYL